jgi:hypothetical protein
MKNSKHTPGPWKLIDTYIEGSNGLLVANSITIKGKDLKQDEENLNIARANAALIAAAPEMLEALELCLAELPIGEGAESSEAYLKTLSAIDKAKGGN